MSKRTGGGLKLYKSYSFRDKDPVIDRIRTIFEDQHVKYKTMEEESGVNAGTLYNWFRGPTKRPQFATIMAVVRALGYDVQIVDPGDKDQVVRLPSSRTMLRDTPIPQKRNGASAAHH